MCCCHDDFMLSYCKRQTDDFTTYEELTILSVQYCHEIIDLYSIVSKLDALQDTFLCASSFGNVGINVKIYMKSRQYCKFSIVLHTKHLVLNDVHHHHQGRFESTAAYENATHIICTISTAHQYLYNLMVLASSLFGNIEISMNPLLLCTPTQQCYYCHSNQQSLF